MHKRTNLLDSISFNVLRQFILIISNFIMNLILVALSLIAFSQSILLEFETHTPKKCFTAELSPDKVLSFLSRHWKPNLESSKCQDNNVALDSQSKF